MRRSPASKHITGNAMGVRIGPPARPAEFETPSVVPRFPHPRADVRRARHGLLPGLHEACDCAKRQHRLHLQARPGVVRFFPTMTATHTFSPFSFPRPPVAFAAAHGERYSCSACASPSPEQRLWRVLSLPSSLQQGREEVHLQQVPPELLCHVPDVAHGARRGRCLRPCRRQGQGAAASACERAALFSLSNPLVPPEGATTPAHSRSPPCRNRRASSARTSRR